MVSLPVLIQCVNENDVLTTLEDAELAQVKNVDLETTFWYMTFL